MNLESKLSASPFKGEYCSWSTDTGCKCPSLRDPLGAQSPLGGKLRAQPHQWVFGTAKDRWLLEPQSLYWGSRATQGQERERLPLGLPGAGGPG